jgi:hypothetical protein
MDETKQRIAFFKTRIHGNPWPIVISSVMAYCLSARWIIYHRSGETTPTDKLHPTHWSSVLLICLWSVGPPLFFLAEYQWFGREKIKAEKLPSVEAFKYTQDLASRFWLAGLLLLVFLYEGRLP